MEVKLPYCTIILDNITIDPVYLPKTGSIIDRNTQKMISQFRILEITKYFRFGLEFDKYKYANYYNPKNNGYHKIVIGKFYEIYLYLNLSEVVNCCNTKPKLYEKITYYLIVAQLKEIEERKKYSIDEKYIDHFIENRKANTMYLVPWYYFYLNDNYSFDLKKHKLVESKYVPKIDFERKGGIIETNDVSRLINDIMFKKVNKSNTLIILPENMLNIWPREYQKMSYNNLIHVCRKKSFEYFKRKPDTLVVHECHYRVLILVKKIADMMRCSYIWVINSLPLRYYFVDYGTSSCKHVPKNLGISDLSSLSNLWMNFSNSNKKIYKNEIIRLILTKLNQYYVILKYERKYQIPKNILQMVPFEHEVYNMIERHYNNWKNKLSNDHNNIFSFTTKEKNTIIESKIFNCSIQVATSVVRRDDIIHLFARKIKNYASKNTKLYSKIKELVCNYYYPCHSEYVDKKIEMICSKIKTANQRIRNYQSYIDKNVYVSLDDKNCPICYSHENLIMTKLICGHNVCLECIINSLAYSNRCPMCNEYVTLDKISVVLETIPNYSSNIIKYIKNISTPTVILTNMDGLNNISSKVVKIINLMEPDVVTKILKYSNFRNVIIATTPKKTISKNIKNELEQIIGYFRLLDNKPSIVRIVITK
jgi:hypothetical protein